MVVEPTDSTKRALRSLGWRDFEISVHRVARSAHALDLGATPTDEKPMFTASGLVKWPSESLTTLQIRRRSCRSFSPRPLTVDQLLDVIVPAFQTPSGKFSCAIPAAIPSITATVLVARVDSGEGARLAQGAYDVSLPAQSLLCIRQVPFARLVSCVDTYDLHQPAAIVMLSLHLARRRQYANAYELGVLEAGQLLQNLSLAATSEGIGSCILGSVFDEPFWAVMGDAEDISDAVKLHGAPIVAVALGHPTLSIDTERPP